MNNQEPKKTTGLGYRLGQAVAVILFACIAAIIITLTFKLIWWIV